MSESLINLLIYTLMVEVTLKLISNNYSLTLYVFILFVLFETGSLYVVHFMTLLNYQQIHLHDFTANVKEMECYK